MALGDILLVPFPFTDLMGQKRRPALEVSPDGFDAKDLILCAITSRLDGRAQWDVSFGTEDLETGTLPRPSAIRTSKRFTMHRGLIVGRFGKIRPQKLADVLQSLQQLFQP
jgi:mRNA interferase MazF